MHRRVATAQRCLVGGHACANLRYWAEVGLVEQRAMLVEFLATKPPPVMNVPVEEANVNVAVPRPATM